MALLVIPLLYERTQYIEHLLMIFLVYIIISILYLILSELLWVTHFFNKVFNINYNSNSKECFILIFNKLRVKLLNSALCSEYFLYYFL